VLSESRFPPQVALAAHYHPRMCGRFTYLFTWSQLQQLLELIHWPDVELSPRYNVAPTQLAPVVRLNAAGERTGVMLKWGLIPSWADDASIGSRLLNARAETVFDKPSFRSAVASRRCLVPISGFYEWQSIPGMRTKRPHWIGRADRAPLCLAGLWEAWKDPAAPNSDPIQSFTILTTAANDFMLPLHDRMPVLLPPSHQAAWLNPNTPRTELEDLIQTIEWKEFTAYTVGSRVGSPAHDDPSLMEPTTEPPIVPNLFNLS